MQKSHKIFYFTPFLCHSSLLYVVFVFFFTTANKKNTAEKEENNMNKTKKKKKILLKYNSIKSPFIFEIKNEKAKKKHHIFGSGAAWENLNLKFDVIDVIIVALFQKLCQFTVSFFFNNICSHSKFSSMLSITHSKKRNRYIK